jgi:hypothetical protein
VAHRAPEVEGALAAVPPLARQSHRELARKGLDGAAQRAHLLAGGMHEVDVLRQRLAQGARHRLHPAIGHEPAPDLGLDLLS